MEECFEKARIEVGKREAEAAVKAKEKQLLTREGELALAGALNREVKRRGLVKVLGEVDPKGEGQIDRIKMRKLLESFGCKVEYLNLEKFFHYYDKDEDGLLNLMELRAVVVEVDTIAEDRE